MPGDHGARAYLAAMSRRTTLWAIVGGAAIVVLIVAGVVIATRSGDDGSGERGAPSTTTTAPGERPTTTLVDCAEGSAIPGGLASTDVRLSPFAADSVWNQPVQSQPSAADGRSKLTAALRADTDTETGGPVHSWVNSREYSMPVVQADPCDPTVRFDEQNPFEPIPVDELRVPADAEPAAGDDKHLLVLQPDGITAVEMFGAEKVSDNEWKVARVEVVDLTGSGIGPDNGVRAYGGSALGGLIRTWEIDPADPNHTDGVIRHPLAMALPSSMLLYTSGDPGYDAEGNGMAQGYVWPATEEDFDAPWSYSGVIPMGARVVLPKSVDLDTLGLGPEARAIAQALQDYGAYVTDRTGSGTVAFYAEPTAPQAWLTSVVGADGTDQQLDRIRAQLVVITPQKSPT